MSYLIFRNLSKGSDDHRQRDTTLLQHILIAGDLVTGGTHEPGTAVAIILNLAFGANERGEFATRAGGENLTLKIILIILHNLDLKVNKVVWHLTNFTTKLP